MAHLSYLYYLYFLSLAELRAELGAQMERERELKEHLEKQLSEEQKIRCKFTFFSFPTSSTFLNFRDLTFDLCLSFIVMYQKRYKKERRFRRKVEQDLQLYQQQHQLQANSAILKASPSPTLESQAPASQETGQTGQTQPTGQEASEEKSLEL